MSCCPTCGRPLSDIDAPGTPGRQATSRAAAAPSKGSERHRVLHAVWQLGAITASELAYRMDANPNQTAARLNELRNGGWVKWSTNPDGTRIRARTRTGHLAYQQEVTEAGLAAVHELGPWEKRTAPSAARTNAT